MSQNYPPARPLPPDEPPAAPVGSYPPSSPTITEDPAGPAVQPGSGVRPDSAGSTTDVAKEQASAVGGSVKDAGQHVAGVAGEQASHVAGEATRQARDLADRTRGELAGQAAQQQRRVAAGLRSLGDQLRRMAEHADPGSATTDLVHQASGKAGQLAGWLEDREPNDVIAEVKRFAARRPGTFLALAATAGVVAGRLTGGAASAAQEDGSDTQPRAHNGSGTYGETGSYGSGGTYGATGAYGPTGAPGSSGAYGPTGASGSADPYGPGLSGGRAGQ